MVCEFAIRMEHPEVKKVVELRNRNASISCRALWASFFSNMKNNGVYAEGHLFCTALKMEWDLVIISFGNNKANPYMHIPSHAVKAYSLLYLGN